MPETYYGNQLVVNRQKINSKSKRKEPTILHRIFDINPNYKLMNSKKTLRRSIGKSLGIGGKRKNKKRKTRRNKN